MVYQGYKQIVTTYQEFYSPLTFYFCESYFVICSKTDSGHEMLGQAKLFMKSPGQPAAERRKVVDKLGRERDLTVPAAFHLVYGRFKRRDWRSRG